MINIDDVEGVEELMKKIKNSKSIQKFQLVLLGLSYIFLKNKRVNIRKWALVNY